VVNRISQIISNGNIYNNGTMNISLSTGGPCAEHLCFVKVSFEPDAFP
jgi:hypothetical protein